MAIPNAAFVTLYWVVNNQLAINVIGARVTGNPTFNQALANTLGSSIKSFYTSGLAAQQPSTTQLVRVGIRDMRTNNQPEWRDSGAPVAGTATLSDPLPTQTALCVTLRTGLSGKSFRGRVYIGGWAESSNDTNGRVNAASQTAAVNFVTAVGTSLSNSQLALAVVSRPSERFTITKTTFHADGSSTADLIGSGNARAGGAEVVTIIESRNTFWETIRRRANSRGALPTALSTGVSVEVGSPI